MGIGITRDEFDELMEEHEDEIKERDAIIAQLERQYDEDGTRLRDEARYIKKLEAERDELKARLERILHHWQYGIGDLNNPWRAKMAELVGDTE